MVDVLPTLLDLCEIHQNKALFDGISLAPTLKKKQPVDPERIHLTDTLRERYPVEGKMSAVIQEG